MAESITITIDGVECACEKGEYIYDVALRNGIFIPVLCRSDAFPDHRACCRVCIVEVDEGRGWTKVVTSCIYPIDKPIAVYTNTDKIKEQRAVIFGLLAARAPESETIANLAKFSGDVGKGRFVTLDSEKCVLCGLCVQACDSLGTGAISTVNRGTDKMVNTPYGKASEDCIGCLSCANVCPTGNITFSETEATRTIWNREFKLAFCEKCGTVLGTEELVERSATDRLCDACRKEVIADEMMAAYRNL